MRTKGISHTGTALTTSSSWNPPTLLYPALDHADCGLRRYYPGQPETRTVAEFLYSSSVRSAPPAITSIAQSSSLPDDDSLPMTLPTTKGLSSLPIALWMLLRI